MHTKIHSNSILLFALLGALVLISLVSRVHAATIFDITYPISELGGCTDKEACKAYCADGANQSVCTDFAAAHGLTTDNKSSNKNDDQKIAQAIQKDGGPGSCAVGASDPQATCKAYCDSTDHITVCVAYGESHGLFQGHHLDEAKKVAAALKSGVKLPNGCTSPGSCRSICENPSTVTQAKSCFAFAKAAGLLPANFDESRAEKVFQSIQDGSSPFKTPQEFQQCEKPKDSATRKMCLDFAVKSGMLTQQEASVVEKTDGKGPGGCEGADACNAYCSSHAQECFKFSKDNGLVTPQQQEQMKRGAEQFKRSLDQASESVKNCLVAVVGQDTLTAIGAGTSMPDQALGEKMHACFEAQGHGGPGDDQDNHNQYGSSTQQYGSHENSNNQHGSSTQGYRNHDNSNNSNNFNHGSSTQNWQAQSNQHPGDQHGGDQGNGDQHYQNQNSPPATTSAPVSFRSMLSHPISFLAGVFAAFLQH